MSVVNIVNYVRMCLEELEYTSILQMKFSIQGGNENSSPSVSKGRIGDYISVLIILQQKLFWKGSSLNLILPPHLTRWTPLALRLPLNGV